MLKLTLNELQFSMQIEVFHEPFYTDFKTQAQSDLNFFAYQAFDNTRIKTKTYTDFINRRVCPIYITYYSKQHSTVL